MGYKIKNTYQLQIQPGLLGQFFFVLAFASFLISFPAFLCFVFPPSANAMLPVNKMASDANIIFFITVGFKRLHTFFNYCSISLNDRCIKCKTISGIMKCVVRWPEKREESFLLFLIFLLRQKRKEQFCINPKET